MSRRIPDPPVSTLAWLWLVGGLGLVLAPHLLRLPAWLGLLSVGAISWRVARDLLGWPLPNTGVRLAFTALGILAIFIAFGTVLGRDAGVGLLAVMLSLKLMEMSTLRDAMLVVLLAYFLVAAGFLFDQSLFAGVYLFSTVVVLTVALLVLSHPGASFGLTRDYLRRAGSLLLQALPLMAVLFVLFPRAQGVSLGFASTANSSRTGLSESMAIGEINQLADSREVAFRVEFATPPPPVTGWYWRGPVLWHSDGRRWTGLTKNELRKAWPPKAFVPEGPSLDYTVSLEPNSTGRWIPVLDIPSRVPSGSLLSGDLQLFAINSEGTRRYALQSYLRYRLPAIPELRDFALALPPEENPRTQELGRTWAAAHPLPEDRVARALDYFREQPFFYTRRPPLLGPDPVDQFVFESRRGFCEHFAASFVTLMRAGGVPARVVTGYQGGEFNRVGNYWVVRQSDAHAWAEVYLDKEGWVRVDPTTVIPKNRIEADAFDESSASDRAERQTLPWALKTWHLAGQSWDAINYQWDRWIAGYSQERQKDLLKRFGLLERGQWALILALAMAAGATLLGAAWFTRRVGRISDPAVRAYKQFCRKLARVGLARKTTEGELEYAARIAAVRPELAAQVAAVTEAYQQARYGRADATSIRRLRVAVGGFRA